MEITIRSSTRRQWERPYGPRLGGNRNEPYGPRLGGNGNGYTVFNQEAMETTIRS